jgi:hypothetical protein
MTREQRRARRAFLQPRRKRKEAKARRSSLCRCETGNCTRHGRFTPLDRGLSVPETGNARPVIETHKGTQ